MSARRLANSAALVLLLTGCVGKENVLFATKTSLGVDIAAKPPTFDLGYGRIEGSIAPVVESGETLPLMAGYTSTNSFFDNLFGFGISQAFAVGNAALIMSRYYNEDHNPAGGVPLDHLVTDPSASAIRGSKDASKRYFFGTDTAFGLKIGFSPETGFIVPDSIVLAWRRKELAYVPIQEVELYPRLVNGDYVQRDGKAVPEPDFKVMSEAARAAAFETETHLVLPSLFASVGVTGGTGSKQSGTTAKVTQIYATGQAATYLASDPIVRTTVGMRILADEELTTKSEQAALDAAIKEADDRDKEARELKDTADKYIDDFNDAQLDLARNGVLFLGLATSLDAIRPVTGGPNTSTEVTWGDADPASKRAALKECTASAGDDTLTPKVKSLVERFNQID